MKKIMTLAIAFSLPLSLPFYGMAESDQPPGIENSEKRHELNAEIKAKRSEIKADKEKLREARKELIKDRKAQHKLREKRRENRRELHAQRSQRKK